ncbi:MAG: hypothetical protein EAY76_04095 [Alphaproteobacteria bacterium]|nr:MAG: hypothetical protein EAY76_04095 [Alphaproteobacteria bacterium]TAF40375.1 MAG: hypothetical protein EAZ66_03215 [Alphaproteobacteria bacterium]TAF77512.1 MAG: hypothetical protein EAZ52_00235 [Alphaproteobacteria bacterium]
MRPYAAKKFSLKAEHIRVEQLTEALRIFDPEASYCQHGMMHMFKRQHLILDIAQELRWIGAHAQWLTLPEHGNKETALLDMPRHYERLPFRAEYPVRVLLHNARLVLLSCHVLSDERSSVTLDSLENFTFNDVGTVLDGFYSHREGAWESLNLEQKLTYFSLEKNSTAVNIQSVIDAHYNTLARIQHHYALEWHDYARFVQCFTKFDVPEWAR